MDAVRDLSDRVFGLIHQGGTRGRKKPGPIWPRFLSFYALALVAKGVWCRDVSVRAELDDGEAGTRSIEPPLAVRRAVDRDVGLAVTVIVARCGDVRSKSEDRHRIAAIRRVDRVPRRLRSTVDTDVHLAVSVIVGRCDLVGRVTELDGKLSVLRTLHVPDAVRRPEQDKVIASVTVIIARCRDVARRAELYSDDAGSRTVEPTFPSKDDR